MTFTAKSRFNHSFNCLVSQITILISGYFFESSRITCYTEFIKKKSKQLLLPCITWGGLILLIHTIVSGFDIMTAIRQDLWFLKNLFICTMLGCLVKLIPNVKYRILLCVILIAITQVSLFRLKDMLPCFFIGMLYRKYDTVINNHKALIISFCTIIYYALAVRYLNSDFFNVDRTSFEYFIKQPSIIIMGVTASIVIILIFSIFENSINASLSRIGSITLSIYLIQSILLESVLPLFLDCTNLNPLINYLLIFPLICFITVCISLIWEKLTKHIRLSFKI